METRTIDGHEYHFTLGDESTLDTVVEVFDVTSGKTETWRWSGDGEDVSYYRDEDGALDFNAFIDDIVGPDASAHDWSDANKYRPVWIDDDKRNAFYDAETQGYGD